MKNLIQKRVLFTKHFLFAWPSSIAQFLLWLTSVQFLLSAPARSQVAYQFQAPNVITLSTAPVTLTMDCLSANGYGQWTSSTSTDDAHLLANFLSSSTTSNPQAGIVGSAPFTFTSPDVYPTTEVMKTAANLKGNVRYVWMQRRTGMGSTDQFYVEGFDPGSSGIDISFSSLPGNTSSYKVLNAVNSTSGLVSIATGHHFVNTSDEANALDRFDIAIDANFLYIVWEEKVSGSFQIWSMILNLSTGATVLAPTQVTPYTGGGSTGVRPTVAVDIRNHGTTVAPFDVAYISAVPSGTVYWTQWQPSSSTFTSPTAIPNSFVDPQNSTSLTWSNPQHARVLAASEAVVSPLATNQRAVYVIADNGGLSLFLDRIIAGVPQSTNEYGDGVYNCSRPSNCPMEKCSSTPPNLFPVLNNPIWAFSNPYQGENASSSLTTSTFTEFHCLYQLDRSSVFTGSAGEYPLMIIPGSAASSGYCVSEASSTTFDEDPITNGNSIMQYCAAVNQMGIHVHWISSNHHFYCRDNRNIDQNIEENTLVTDICNVDDGTGHGGSLTPTLLSGLTMAVYSDPANQGAY